ncbi:hypothetical protein J2W22_000392 [Sphingomonas kyeonggiensis]|uniref:hypothetical protein n=1 Tax=Sphingomonas kyeonggiensis TaxID=1268553 RepID=UPI00277FDDB4|nr:hypothetical protein [Sphingomonas kyeonggiensis]MDQ0248345.1 hypothetical protein [Sphingomonas kyeonggiensis]
MRLALALTLLAAPLPAFAQEPGPQDARDMVQAYYAAIERGDFRAAYGLWDRGGQASGKSFASFRQGFAATAHSRVETRNPGREDAGMSQRWITVPVDVYATLKNGKRQHFRGSYTLHRVVPGVSANRADTRWHLSSAKLVAVR